MWHAKRLADVPPVDLATLPSYGWAFFFRYMRGFRLPFALLTLCRVTSSFLSFFGLYLLSEIFSQIVRLSVDRIFHYYAPLWLASAGVREILDYFTRRYGETLPTIYGEYTSLRFYRTVLDGSGTALTNVSKERLATLISRYVGTTSEFLSGWCWNSATHATNFIVVLVILYRQSPTVLALSLTYMAFFLAMSLRIARKFAPVAQDYASTVVTTSTIMWSFQFNLDTIRRLRIRDFYLATLSRRLAENWRAFDRKYAFHAGRWMVQLGLFQVLSFGTLVYGFYQVKIGVFGIGYLLLVKRAFEELNNVSVFLIESYVGLISQREDATIARDELGALRTGEAGRDALGISSFTHLELRDVHLEFPAKENAAPPIHIRVPHLDVKRGAKIGIVGTSGSGKTSILFALLNLVPFEGDYRISGHDAKERHIPRSLMTLISANEPLFKLSVRDNILLGRDVADRDLRVILEGARITEFLEDMDQRVGDPAFNLSAGQEQRVRIARGLSQQTDIYLLDEPFNALDGATKSAIITFLRHHLSDKTVLLVTHNPEELALVDEVYELREGTLRRQGRTALELPTEGQGPARVTSSGG